MIQLRRLVHRFAAYVDAEAFVGFFVYRGQDDGEVGVAAAELFELLLGERRIFVGDRAYAQSDQHFVGVEARVVVAEVAGF